MCYICLGLTRQSGDPDKAEPHLGSFTGRARLARRQLTSYQDIPVGRFWCFCLVCLTAWPAAAADLSDRVERLANPLQDKDEYARNLWDLQRYRGRIYLGGGSPLTNPGPLAIWSYDPARGRLLTELAPLQQESIDLFRVFDGELYLPSADPRNPANSDRSKYYRYGDGVWRHHLSDETLATAHIRDLHRYADGLIVAVGNSRGIAPGAGFMPGAVYSADDGQSFQPAVDGADLVERSGVFFSLFAYQGRLFATTTYFSRAPEHERLGVYVFDRSARRLRPDPQVGNRDFIPPLEGFDRRIILQPWLPVAYRGVLLYPVKARLVYPAEAGLIEVEQFRQAYGFYSKNGLAAPPRAVQFADSGAIGEDVVIADDAVYVLANRRQDSGRYTVYLYTSSLPADPTAWREVLRFDSANVAKSLEILDGYAYFGLGREAADALNDAGALLRVALPGATAGALPFTDQFER